MLASRKKGGDLDMLIKRIENFKKLYYEDHISRIKEDKYAAPKKYISKVFFDKDKEDEFAQKIIFLNELLQYIDKPQLRQPDMELLVNVRFPDVEVLIIRGVVAGLENRLIVELVRVMREKHSRREDLDFGRLDLYDKQGFLIEAVDELKNKDKHRFVREIALMVKETAQQGYQTKGPLEFILLTALDRLDQKPSAKHTAKDVKPR
jgi:hypothetical protein